MKLTKSQLKQIIKEELREGWREDILKKYGPHSGANPTGRPGPPGPPTGTGSKPTKKEEMSVLEHESSDPLKKIFDILESVLESTNMSVQNLGTSRSLTDYERGAEDLAEQILHDGLEEAVRMLKEILDAADQKAADEILSTLGRPLPKTLPGGVKYEE